MPDNRPMAALNPYEAPHTVEIKPAQATALFEVGKEEPHTVEVFLSMWGSEIYAVDGAEVLRKISFEWRGIREFSVGVVERHEVRIRYDLLPTWSAAFSPAEWIAEAYVDGVLVVPDLIPDFRQQMHTLLHIAKVLLTVLVILLVAALFLLLVLKLLLLG
jgi:hypothetical protein